MIDIGTILSIVRADETREIVQCVCVVAAFVALAIPTVYCLWRKFYGRLGIGFVLIAAGFLDSMATKKPAIELTGETVSNLTFHCSCVSNLVGESAYFRYTVDGEDYSRSTPSFFVPATNFNHTLNGCFIGGGKTRLFQLVIEEEISNEVAR